MKLACHSDAGLRLSDLPNLSRGAFSLLELLIALAIVIILTTLYFGPNSAGKQQALQRVCQKNLEKIFVSMEIYANEQGGRFPQKPGAITSAQALAMLIPKYTSDTSPFICPGSKDSMLPPAEPFGSRTISYAYYMGRPLTNSTLVLMSDRQVDTSAKSAGAPVFSSHGKPPGNNHHKFGGNLLFTDGHTASISPTAPFALPLNPGESLLNP